MNQAAEAQKNNIALADVRNLWNQEVSRPLLEGEIPGASVVFHSMKKGGKLCLQNMCDRLRTLLLVDGDLEIMVDGRSFPVNRRGSMVTGAGTEVQVDASADSHFLEILWTLDEAARAKLADSNISFPVWQDYEECSQYREDFKTKKSISRSLVDHHLLPDFCMGSNESYGPDRVEKHAHPLLDQFFFSFEENDILLMIDDMIQPYAGYTLLHIPLGSDHGVIIPEGKKMHYVWIDFMVGTGAVEYLDEVHKKTGVMEKFDENHQITR